MRIEFRLPDVGRTDSILIDIEEILLDSIVLLHSDVFNAPPAMIELALERESCSKGIPLNYHVYTGDRSFSGLFMGSCDSIIIDLDGQHIYYEKHHPFFRIYEWSNSGSNDSIILDSMDREIIRLRREDIFPSYLDYILYNGVVQGFYEYDTLNALLGLDSMDSYWIRAMREKLFLKDSRISAIGRKLETLLKTESIVLLKFWGEWCAPCMRDNETIVGIMEAGDDFPYILGIQNDRSAKVIPQYENVLDPDGFIAKHFRLNAYPMYVLFSTNGEEFRTNKLSEIRAFISAR